MITEPPVGVIGENNKWGIDYSNIRNLCNIFIIFIIGLLHQK